MTNVALIGLGMVSKTYAEALLDLAPAIALKGVYARTPESCQAFLATHFPSAIAYDSVEAIANDPDIDFAILTTPPNARQEIVATLAAGAKPILMEKPIERTVEAAEALAAHPIPIGIMLQHRMRPAAIALAERIPTLGPLRAVEASIPWWRDQAYYDEPGRGTYTRDGGGVLISQAIHTLDLMLSLTGPVKDVTALTGTTGFHKMESEDFVAAGLTFQNGALGHLFATTASFPGRSEALTLHFAEASAHLEGNLLTLTHKDGSHNTAGATAATGAGADPMAFTSDWHRDMIVDFALSLTENRAPKAPIQDALEVHRLIAALEKSGQTGQRQPV